VHEGGENHQVGCPGMDGSNEPSELHARHDVLHALESFIGAGPVVQKQQQPRANLDPEEKKRDAAQEVPIGELVNGNGFVTQGFGEFCPIEARIDPAADMRDDLHLRRSASG
jgi:hypothetical protein